MFEKNKVIEATIHSNLKIPMIPKEILGEIKVSSLEQAYLIAASGRRQKIVGKIPDVIIIDSLPEVK